MLTNKENYEKIYIGCIAISILYTIANRLILGQRTVTIFAGMLDMSNVSKVMSLIGNVLIFANTVFIFIFAAILSKGTMQRRNLRYLGFVSLFGMIWLFSCYGTGTDYAHIAFVSRNDGYIFRILMMMSAVMFIKTADFNEKSGKKGRGDYFQNITFFMFAAFAALAPVLSLLSDGVQTIIYRVVQAAIIASSVNMVFVVKTEIGNKQNTPILLLTGILFVAVNISEFFWSMGKKYGSWVTPFMIWGFLIIVCILWILLLRAVYIDVQKSNEMRTQIMESQMQLMLSQIKPHFIYNALNSIHILIKKDPEVACQMVTNFSSYLRSNMNAMENKKLATFREELEHIKAYVEIEKVRFPKIEVIFEIDEINFNIPVLTVEPLVENAIKHGVARSREGGIVTIRAYRSGAYIYITVVDNGIGFDTKLLSDEDSKSLGIRNVKYRLETVMDGNLTITSEVGKGTIATIKLPVAKAKES